MNENLKYYCIKYEKETGICPMQRGLYTSCFTIEFINWLANQASEDVDDGR
jgi:hypothetical protein